MSISGQFARTNGAHHRFGEFKDTRRCKAKRALRWASWTPKFRNKKLIDLIVHVRECDDREVMVCNGDGLSFERHR